MGQIIHTDVQHSDQWGIRRVIQEVNDRLSEIVSAVSINRFYSVPQFSYVTSTAGTEAVWITDEEYAIESVSIVSTVASGTVDILIDGVSVGGGTFALTTSPVNHPIGTPNETTDLSTVSIVTASLGGGICTISMNLRRLN